METTDKIRFKVNRDMGETFGIGFKFLRQNFALFSKCILFIVGPFLLLSSISTGILYTGMMGNIANPTAFSNPNDVMAMYLSWEFLLVIIGSLLTGIFWIGALLHFLRLYQEHGKNGFTVEDVWKAVVKDIWAILGTMLGLGVIFFIITIVFSLLVGLMAVGSAVFIGFFIFFLFIGMFILMPVANQYFISVFSSRIIERKSFSESITRPLKLIKGQYWWTWLLNFCVMLMGYFAMYVFMIPMYLVMMFFAFNSLKDASSIGSSFGLTAGMTIAIFLGTLVWSVPYLILNFQHFSLVEKKEGTGVIELIDQFGQNQQEEDGLEY